MADRNWHVVETAFDPQALHHKETVFTIGNGYVGTRGAFEEGYPGACPATLVHGVFDDHPTVYTELANVPNWLSFILRVNGERFRMDRGKVLSYQRDLDLRTGTLTRTVRWQSAAGHTVDLSIRRFASLADQHLLAIRTQVTALDFSGILELRAGLDGHTINAELFHWQTEDQGPILRARLRRPPSISRGEAEALPKGPVLSAAEDPGEARAVYLHVRTRHSGIEVNEACHLKVSGCDVSYAHLDCESAPAVVARVEVRQGESITGDKLVALVTSREEEDVRAATLAKLEAAVGQGYDELWAANAAAWEREWQTCNVTIEGDDKADLALRYSLFQLLIAAPRHDDRVSIPAKTLSGFGYRGHVFWDTETFIVPFFTCTRPEIARNLLMYRYHTLPGARRKAQENGYEGAMFAWESADSGDETTPRFVPGPEGELLRIWPGDIEHHITADVAYAVMQYWRATGDDGFMRDYGAEIVLDAARFWGSRAEWNGTRGRYEINDVIGPDEYHDHVDNNVYTNRMARWNIQSALALLDWLRQAHPDKAAGLEARLDLSDRRLAHWANVIDKLTIAHDPETGLMEQFEGYFRLEDIDLAAYEPRDRSIPSILGVEETQGTQVIKQPDVLMLLYLLEDRYDTQTMRANWDYYTPRTDLTHGSSLGPPIQALLAARMGDPELAYAHFIHAARTDLQDARGNADEGIHGATAGGLWQAVVFGFAGLRLSDEGYTTTPHLPAHWKRLCFSFLYRGERIDVELIRDG